MTGAALAKPDRRTLIRSATAVGLLSTGLLPARARSLKPDPFTQGVASGDPATDGFVIWTRLAPDPLSPDGKGGIQGDHIVHWEVAADDQMRIAVARGAMVARDARNHAVHKQIRGLKPNRPYWYRFISAGWQSAIGRSRTLPLANDPVQKLRIAFVSCSNWEEGWFTAYSRIVEEEPDFVVFLGDYIYEYNNTGKKAENRVRLHVGPEAADLAGYRLRYSLYRTDSHLQRLHASVPALVTWDDHEVENDYASQWSEHVHVPVDAFLTRRRAAYQVFFENMPLRAAAEPHGDAMQVYDRFRFGNLAEIPLLDGRQYRDMEACPKGDFRGGHVVPGSCEERLDPGRTMLGPKQEHWLIDGFRHSEARWNIIAQDLLIASFTQKGADGAIGHWTDGWDGYPACRARILSAVKDSGLRNPVFFGGDIHSFWATDLKIDFSKPESETVATEFVGGSVTADAPPYAAFADFLPQNPHVKFFDSRVHGYMLAEVTPVSVTTQFMAVDRITKDAPSTLLAAFAVENGKAGAVRL